MPGEPSTFGAGVMLDAVNGRATQTARTTYVALLTSAPTDATILSTMAEVTTAGYSRVAATWAAPSGDPASSSNTNVLTFGPFTADPPNITHCALVSAASGTVGDFLYWWALGTARDGISGDSASFAAGALVMTQD